jgi:hypothetical protein
VISFCFFVEVPAKDVADQVEELTKHLNQSRDWLSGGITFVSELDQSDATQSGDQPIYLLGGTLWLTEPDEGDERRQFEDVRFLIEALASFTEAGPAVVIEYASEEIGTIEGGEVDHSITSGLLEPWERRIAERP